ncbi:DUF397 domain-containing protein [Actinomadura sp. KC06]|uniref:DUF397 domain-containing protein n=1 Tax=Actinomadura sp. KC06 TaxID=2530369 RepID=UPI001047129C|nr:DUF397 domain-containing protein [Actinomadura sp. KC06]TDD29284.1 DUF397 domain-containing protein [Actinomadura sp. KC06]
MIKQPTWRKSSYSGGEGGQCVELAFLDDSVGIRDSKSHRLGPLTVGREALRGLVGRIKAGDLDL